MLRPGTPADLDAVVALALAEEAAWFGAAESSHDELVDYVRFSGGIEAGVVADDGRIRGFALVTTQNEAVLFLDPADPDPPFDAVIGWARAAGAHRLEAQPSDAARTAWLERNGWAHVRSVFDLGRAGTACVDVAAWPDGVEVGPFEREDDVAVHRLVYVDAAYAAVPGHPDRTLENWREWFASPGYRGWVARRAGRPVGWVMGRVLDDGRGWVSQLAVSLTERGNGLGRALLTHSTNDLLAAGADGLGLNVQADNANAIGLYRSVGLDVEREWLVYEVPVANGVTG